MPDVQGKAPSLLRAGALSCLYQDGWLRYIAYNGAEIVRMFYAAVRDQYWDTVESGIEEESIDILPDSFRISYIRTFRKERLIYRARIVIEGHASGRLSFLFHGEALSSFLRNRIGLCVHLPIEGCAGKQCSVADATGGHRSGVFPVGISPHQPFGKIHTIAWQPDSRTIVSLALMGEVFEMEDHRNWTDASFKIYGTPLERPFPVAVAEGETLTQRAVLTVTGGMVAADAPSSGATREVKWLIGRDTTPFPQLGISLPLETADGAAGPDRELASLRRLSLSYYRIELYLGAHWRSTWDRATRYRRQLPLPLAVTLQFTGFIQELPLELEEALVADAASLHSILLLQEDHHATPATLVERLVPRLRAMLPGVPIGTGTSHHFAEWNRAGDGLPLLDFTSYPVMPQVHARDTLSLIENLAAQHATIVTAAGRARGVPIHVSPVTLRGNGNRGKRLSENVDARQGSLFAAAWTAVSLHYLRGARAVTYFESAGPCGILPDSGDTVYPVYLLLGVIAKFNPDSILESRCEHPLTVDGLALGKATGDRLFIISNFSGELCRVSFDASAAFFKTLAPDNLEAFLNAPDLFINGAFQPRAEGSLALPPYSLTFLTNQPQHG